MTAPEKPPRSVVGAPVVRKAPAALFHGPCAAPRPWGRTSRPSRRWWCAIRHTAQRLSATSMRRAAVGDSWSRPSSCSYRSCVRPHRCERSQRHPQRATPNAVRLTQWTVVIGRRAINQAAKFASQGHATDDRKDQENHPVTLHRLIPPAERRTPCWSARSCVHLACRAPSQEC